MVMIDSNGELMGMSEPWAEIVGVKDYALAIYRLQNEAGLTFREARAVLTPLQAVRNLMEEWNCSLDDIEDLVEKGREKLNKHTGRDTRKNEELAPTCMWYIM